ncbi:transposase, partial [Micromonospora sp. MP36]
MVPRRDRLLTRAGRQAWPKSGPSPVDRARPGSKHHVLTEGAGIPLAVSLTGGNRHDVTELLPLIDKIPLVRGRRGRPHSALTSCSPTAPTTMTSTARQCAARASARASPAVASPTDPVSVCSGGWS